MTYHNEQLVFFHLFSQERQIRSHLYNPRYNTLLLHCLYFCDVTHRLCFIYFVETPRADTDAM